MQVIVFDEGFLLVLNNSEDLPKFALPRVPQGSARGVLVNFYSCIFCMSGLLPGILALDEYC